MREGLISVIVPVLHDVRLELLLRSLRSQEVAGQQYEVIVVDNAGDEEIAQIARRYGCRYVVETLPGSYAARNAGLHQAAGDIVAFTDADCVADSKWLDSLARAFDASEIGGVGGRIKKLSRDTWLDRASRDLVEGQARLQQLPFSPLPFVVTGNAAYRATVLRQIGGFDPRFRSGGDVDLSWRVVLAGHQLRVVPDAVIYHASRRSVRAYFRQYAVYATGHARLFKKYHRRLNRHWFINTYPVAGLKYAWCDLVDAISPGQRDSNQRFEYVQRAALQLVMCAGIAYGDLRGAIRYRTLYL